MSEDVQDKKYIVCSDESGTWNSDVCGNYIRVFCIFSEGELELLNSKYKNVQTNVQKHPSDLSLIQKLIDDNNISVEICVYFNLICDEKSGRDRAKEVIDELGFPSMKHLSDEIIKKSFKETFDNLYYLHYIESHFFDNFIQDTQISLDEVKEFIIENPQFIKKRFKEFFHKKFPNIKLNLESKPIDQPNHVGTQLCDRVASLYQNELNNGEHHHKQEATWVKARLVVPKHSKCNPSKVFWLDTDSKSDWYGNLKTKKWGRS